MENMKKLIGTVKKKLKKRNGPQEEITLMSADELQEQRDSNGIRGEKKKKQKKEKKQKKKGEGKKDDSKTERITRKPTVINISNVPSFNEIRDKFISALKQAKQNPLEFLYATVVLRFAIEKELAMKKGLLGQDDFIQFLKQLSSEEISIEQLAVVVGVDENLQNFSKQRQSVFVDFTFGSVKGLLPQVIAIFNPQNVELPTVTKESVANEEVMLKFRMYIEFYTKKYRETNNYLTADQYARERVDVFWKKYQTFLNANRQDALFYAEAEVKGIKQQDAYVGARKAGHSISYSEAYAFAVLNNIQFPEIYAKFIEKGSEHKTASTYALLLGEKQFSEEDLEIFIKYKDEGKTDDYALTCVDAKNKGIKYVHDYAEAICDKKDEERHQNAMQFANAVSYAIGIGLLPPDETKWYGEAICEGKNKTQHKYVLAFKDAVNLGIKNRTIYATAITQNCSPKEARFIAEPTWGNWFKANPRKTIVSISCLLVPFLFLLCKAHVDIVAQEEQLEKTKLEIETKQRQNKQTKTKTSDDGRLDENKGMTEISLKDVGTWKKDPEIQQGNTQRNEETWHKNRKRNDLPSSSVINQGTYHSPSRSNVAYVNES